MRRTLKSPKVWIALGGVASSVLAVLGMDDWEPVIAAIVVAVSALIVASDFKDEKDEMREMTRKIVMSVEENMPPRTEHQKRKMAEQQGPETAALVHELKGEAQS